MFENATVKRSSQFVASSFHTIIALLLGLIMLRFSKLIYYTIIPNSCRDAVQKVWRLDGQPSHKGTAGHRALFSVSFFNTFFEVHKTNGMDMVALKSLSLGVPDCTKHVALSIINYSCLGSASKISCTFIVIFTFLCIY